MHNGPGATGLYVQDLFKDGRKLPQPRTLTEPRAAPRGGAHDLNNYVVALVQLPAHAHAAE